MHTNLNVYSIDQATWSEIFFLKKKCIVPFNILEIGRGKKTPRRGNHLQEEKQIYSKNINQLASSPSFSMFPGVSNLGGKCLEEGYQQHEINQDNSRLINKAKRIKNTSEHTY